MSKHLVLEYLAEYGAVDAFRVAVDLDMAYPAAAMMLLRLTRQGLVSREFDTGLWLYVYQLTGSGHARLQYFQSEASADGELYAP